MECFDYANQKITRRKSTNSQYVAKFLVVSVIENENDFHYDNKTNNTPYGRYINKENKENKETSNDLEYDFI